MYKTTYVEEDGRVFDTCGCVIDHCSSVGEFFDKYPNNSHVFERPWLPYKEKSDYEPSLSTNKKQIKLTFHM